jgi:hypothetical protein
MPSRKKVEWDFRLLEVKMVDMTSSSLTVRQAHPAEQAVELLVQLDTVKPLTGLVLVAEAEGRPVAAISVDDGRTAADPFLPSADAVAVLRMRAAQLQPGVSAGAQRRRFAGWRANRRPSARAA